MPVSSWLYLGLGVGGAGGLGRGAECGEGTPQGTGPHIVHSRWAGLHGERWKNKNKFSWAAAQLGREGSVSPLGHPSPERMTSPSSPSHDSDLPAEAGPSPHQKKQPAKLEAGSLSHGAFKTP